MSSPPESPKSPAPGKSSALHHVGPLGPSKPRVKVRRSERFKELLPDIWAIVRPHLFLLGFGMVLIVVSRAAGLIPSYTTRFLVDDVLGKHRYGELPGLALLVGGATIVQSVTGWILMQMFGRATQRLMMELRCKLHAHVLRLPMLYHDEHKSGSLASRVMNDVAGLQNLIGTGLLQFVGSLLTSIIALVLMARASFVMTAVAFAGVVGFGMTLGRMTAKLKELSRERTELSADVMGRLTEALGGVRVIKGYHAEAREERIFSTGMGKLYDNFLASLRVTSGLGLVTNVIWGAAGALVMYMGAKQIIAGTMSLGTFFTFTLLLGILVQPLLQLVTVGSQLTEAVAGLERTREILRVAREESDPRRTVALGTIRGEVVVEDVTFAYQPGKPVLQSFALRAAPGTVTALVGPSGSGKSTTIGLIGSFYAPTEGRVMVDGVDLATVELESYRRQIGVVLQETFLFDGSILDNIRFAKPDATDDEVLAACRTARVDEFVEGFEEGYHTVVGERGVKLSGGQRQRISIARAILADPRILILDEATSSLDTHSEALIQEALAKLLVGRTTFVIAHRLSTIRKADQILVVEKGRIIERGSHDELVAKGGMYRDMYMKQHAVDADMFLAPGEGDRVVESKKQVGSIAGGIDEAGALLTIGGG